MMEWLIGEELHVHYSLNQRSHDLLLKLAPGGGAIVRVNQGRLSASLIKGYNDYANLAINPACSLDHEKVATQSTGDLLALWEKGTWRTIVSHAQVGTPTDC